MSVDDISTVASRDRVGGHAAFLGTIFEGPDRGRLFHVDSKSSGRVLVGQSAACDVQLTDRQVSRRHVALELCAERLRIMDLGSTNGTFVDGLRVLDAFLVGGECVRLGATALRVDPVVEAAPEPLARRTSFGKLLGASDAMRRLYPLCERLAASSVPVLIEGETGTGKEVLAEALHDEGPRRDGPFVVFDCTAVAPTLVESELFGHERGAFTGAVGVHRGVFEQANGGTLLIDEIGDLDLTLQAKLLRVIQRGEVRRVGGDKSLSLDVRVLSATRRNLDIEVQAGRFRDDLFYRLVVARVELPPLRARGGDVELLARRFWSELGGDARGLGYDALARLETCAWPGNVRELYNAVSRIIALGSLDAGSHARTGSLEVHPSQDQEFAELLAMKLPLSQARARLVERFERRYLEHVLVEHGGNVRRAAESSGVARRYFQLLRAKREST